MNSAPQPAGPVQTPFQSTRLLVAFWMLVLVSIPIWLHFEVPGWDTRVYLNAMHSLAAGHDPYTDAIAVQRAYHAQAVHPAGDPPWSYVYAPITLPLLGLLARLPLWLVSGTYWLVYAVAILAQLRVCLAATEPAERRPFLYLAAVASFFPGLLANGIIIGGNIAYILYALVLLGALHGWRRGRWVWFYLAVVAASCVKAPLLSLVVIAPLSGRRQWLAAGAATAAGLALFASQPLLWPVLFKHYLEAVELQFSFNRDFGCSPAGLFGGFLYDRGIPYSPGTYVFFLAYAIPLFAVLVMLSRRFLRGDFTIQRWIPVLLVGVILLNPRILEYDAAPIALPIALIAWRFFAAFLSRSKTIVALALLFAVTNAVAAISWNTHKLVDGPLLVLAFAAGCWNLLHTSAREALNAQRTTNN